MKPLKEGLNVEEGEVGGVGSPTGCTSTLFLP